MCKNTTIYFKSHGKLRAYRVEAYLTHKQAVDALKKEGIHPNGPVLLTYN